MDIGMHLSLMEAYPTTLAIRILASKHLLLMDAFLALLSIPQIAMKLNDSSVRHKFSYWRIFIKINPIRAEILFS